MIQREDCQIARVHVHSDYQVFSLQIMSAPSSVSTPSLLEKLEMNRQLRVSEVARLVGLKRSSIYAWMEAGKFPKGRNLSPRCRRWSAGEIHEWLEKQNSPDKASHPDDLNSSNIQWKTK